MDVMKAKLSREALKGFFTFLLAEKARHQEDIDMITDKLNKLSDKYQFTDQETVLMYRESRRFVKI
jgi:hypothetical protein